MVSVYGLPTYRVPLHKNEKGLKQPIILWQITWQYLHIQMLAEFRKGKKPVYWA